MATSILERLRAAVPKDGWRVENYSGQFSWLWDIESTKGGGDGSLRSWLTDGVGEKNILILWDEMPPLDVAPINITDHLTPIDWALALSRNLLFECGDNRPPVRIFILDYYSRRLPSAYACRMVDSLLAALRWIWVVRLLPDGDSDRSIADQFGVEQLKAALKGDHTQFPTLRVVNPQEALQKVDTLIYAWLGDLARTATHHDVNNILGPLVLLESFMRTSAYADRGRRALLQHARWLGLTLARDKASVIGGAAGVWFDARTLAKELGRTIRFVLVDDQANNGWKEVVAAALGIAPADSGVPMPMVPADRFVRVATEDGVELWATTSAAPVIERLKEVLKPVDVPSVAHDSRFELQFTEREVADGGDTEPPMEVLLLDLRLTTERETEVQVFDAVLDLVEVLNQRSVVGRPWRPLPTDGFEVGPGKANTLRNLRAWVGDYAKTSDVAAIRRGKTTYLTMLTLLSRVIATMDLSLPIILFSSSGQRVVTEECRGYGNIITAFEKPRFLGYQSDDMFLEAKIAFAAASAQAATLLRARAAVQCICKQRAPVNANRVTQANYVEIFIDESGSPGQLGFTIAGLVLIYPDREVANAVDVKMSQTKINLEGRQVSLRWTGDGDCLPKRLAMDTKDSIRVLDSTIFPAIAETYKNLGVTALPFALRAWQGADIDSGINLLSEQHLDNLYLHTAKEVLDAVLYELIPWNVSKETTGDICIYAATRLRVMEGGFSNLDKTHLFERFGILVERIKDRTAFRSVRSDSFAPLVADVLRNRPNTEKPIVTAAVGVPINPKDDGNTETTLDTILAPAKQMPWYASEFFPPNKVRDDDFGMLAIIERKDGRETRQLLGNKVYDDFKNTMFGYAENVSHLRQSHFIADLLAYTAFKSRESSMPEWYIANHHFGNGMLDDLGESGFEFAIDASKCLEAQDRPGALLRATVAAKAYTKWGKQVPGYHQESIVPRVLAKIAGCLPDLSGNDFLIYCRALRDWVKGAETEPKSLPQRTGLDQIRSWEDLPPPWNNRIPQTGVDGHDLTVAGFAEGIKPGAAEQLVRAYLEKHSMLANDSRIEGTTFGKGKYVICKLFNLPKDALALLTA